MTDEITTPKDALVYIDFLARFGAGDAADQWRGISKVIRSLMRKAERAALLSERQEAVVASGADGDVVELLRGIRAVMAARPDGRVFGDVCKKAADEIEWLRWQLRDTK